MHLKVYVFGGANATTAIVGSPNMTQGGLMGNWELSALIQGRDVDWESGLSKWIQDRVEDGEIVEADAATVECYKIRRDIYLAHMKMAERALNRSSSSDPRVLYDLVLEYMDQVPRAGINVITEILH